MKRDGPGRTVYIALRVWNKKAMQCRGLSLRAVDFTPQEVHDIIKEALTTAATRARLKALAKGRG